MNDLTAINNYFGQYYPQIIRTIYDGLTIAEDSHVINNLTSKQNLWRYDATDGLRPVDTSIEDTNRSQGNFTLRSIEPNVFMKILKVIPEELRKTFLSEGLSPNAKDYPGGFVQYFFEEQGKHAIAELNQNAYLGVDPSSVAAFNSGSAYAVGDKVTFVTSEGKEYFECTAITTAGQTPITHPAKWKNINNRCLAKGYGTIIAEEIVAGSIAPISLGSLTDSNAFDKIDTEFYQSIPEVVRDNADSITILMSKDNARKRRNALMTKYPNSPEIMMKEGNTSGNIWGTDGRDKVKGVNWLRGSNRIIANVTVSGKKNLVMGVDRAPDVTNLNEFIKTLHGYKGILKGIVSYQIADPRYLFVNDLA